MKYSFEAVTACNMCGAVGAEKILGKRLNKSQGWRPAKRGGISTTIVQCKRCDLIYANPQPVPENLEQHYGMPADSYWKPEYFQLDDAYFDHQIATFFRIYGKREHLAALDIGAGIGKCMIALEKAGFDVSGFEPSLPFYDKAIDRMRINPSKLRRSSIETSDYPENSFDFITFGAVLEHLYDPSFALQKALEWCKPGGLIHVEIPSAKWLVNRIANLVYKVQGLDYVSNISPMHAPFHLYEFGLKSFQANARILGYQIVYHCFYVCNTYMPAPLDSILKPIMRKSDTGMQLEIWLRKTV